MNNAVLIAQNLRNIRKSLNFSQKEIAEKLNINPRTYASYERGEREPGAAFILKFCETFNLSSDDIIQGKEKSAPIIEDRSNINSVPKVEPSLTTRSEYRGFAVLDHDNIYMIPIYRSVSAGYGAFADEYIIGHEPVYLSSPKEAEETFAVAVKGDSMYPKIEEDDLVIVHKQDCFENGDIVVAVDCSENTGFVKRAFQSADKLTLESLNPQYAPMIFTGPKLQDIKIMGVVRKIIKSV